MTEQKFFWFHAACSSLKFTIRFHRIRMDTHGNSSVCGANAGRGIFSTRQISKYTDRLG